MSGLSIDAPSGKTELARRFQLDLGEYVNDASISHDGSLAAIGTGGGEVVVLELKTGAVSWRAKVHEGRTLAVAFSPREPLLVTAGEDARARLFEAGGALRAELPGKGSGWVEHVAWAPDGKSVGTSSGRVLRLWTSAGEPRLETEPHPSTITGLAWRKDGRELATCCYGGVHLWTVASGARGRQLEWKGSLISMAWSPDGKVIACGSQDASVHFWRLPSGTDSEMSGYPFKPKVLAWDSGSTMLATGGDATITVWKFVGKGPEGKAPQQLKGHKALCTAMAFGPKSGRLATGAQDTGIIVWEPHRGDKPVRYAFLDEEITKLVWHPGGRQLLAADAGGGVGLFEVG